MNYGCLNEKRFEPLFKGRRMSSFLNEYFHKTSVYQDLKSKRVQGPTPWINLVIALYDMGSIKRFSTIKVGMNM